ncbi:MAG TPA: hypothetical protein RMF84_02695 [Polyangiaceae bacterium LLY-WYZ-14_1]|nr:hypothetical protein [Polyangiaceae bacterium LLY-WYZ-14_1]
MTTTTTTTTRMKTTMMMTRKHAGARLTGTRPRLPARGLALLLGAVLWPLSALAGCGGAGGQAPSPGPMPEGGTFTGVYNSIQYGEMNMVQSGEGVVGEFEKDDRSGTIQGVATGDLLRFRWSQIRELVQGRPTESTGRGYFRYERGEDGRDYLIGEWWLGESEMPPADQRSGWRAIKLRNRTPELTRIGAGTGTSGGEDEGDLGDEMFDEEGAGDETDDDDAADDY